MRRDICRGVARGSRGAAALLAPAAGDCDTAAQVARELHPLGLRIVAVEPLAALLKALRVPCEVVTVDEAARRVERGDVRLALVTGLGGDGGEGRARTRLRSGALLADVPCFTSTLLFAAAAAVVADGVDDGPRALPTGAALHTARRSA